MINEFNRIFNLMAHITKNHKDRKLVTDLLQIESSVSAIQAKYFELEEENFELKKNLSTNNLQTNNLLDKYEFDKTYGIYKSKSKEDELYYCTSCLLKGIVSPLKENRSRWSCLSKECGQFYENPFV